MVRVKRQGKDSLRYDGKTQDIKRRFIMSEYQDGMAVGSTVRMHWGRKSRIRTAVVVDQLPLRREDERYDDQAATESATTSGSKGKCKRVCQHPDPETASNKRGKYM